MTLYVGLMSGTSLDSIDAALVDIDDSIVLKHSLNYPLPDTLRASLVSLTAIGNNEIERLGCADRELGLEFASAVNELLRVAGVSPTAVRAIGSHGQTVRHRPPSAQRPVQQAFSLQIGDPNSIVQATGITTVADFRRRDIAAGGQGAPLAPAFHREVFHSDSAHRAIVNIGGMANITLLTRSGAVQGFDCGPGNILMDSWIQYCRQQSYDRDGQWAASGQCDPALLERLLTHPYFSLNDGPRSTGREDFHLDYLLEQLAAADPVAENDVQATALELTAASIVAAVDSLPTVVDEIYICGGGAYNRALMARLEQLLSPRPVHSTLALGLAPEWVEATAFAWLAHRCLAGLPGNDPAVTGAGEAVVLGGIYPA